MKIFLSWSGEKSKAAARAFREWLPGVIQALQPWMSDVDITPGRRWSNEVQQQLSDTNCGVLLVTRSNSACNFKL